MEHAEAAVKWAKAKGESFGCGLGFCIFFACLFTVIGFGLLVSLVVTEPAVLTELLDTNSAGADVYKHYHLPKTVIPLQYNLIITPKIPISTYIAPNAFSYNGTVTIPVNITTSAGYLIIHAGSTVNFTAVTLNYSGGNSYTPRGIDRSVDDYAQFIWPTKVPAGSATLTISFVGSISQELRGFYRGSFHDPANDETLWIGATQFQPLYARYAFPCFDEPQLKAPFALQVVAPAPEMLVLSNNPGTKASVDPESGTQLWTFPPTAPLSTYNMAWVITKRMDSVKTTHTDMYSNGQPVEITIYTRPGVSGFANFALNTTSRFLGALNKMLKVPYPLNKLDIIALPDSQLTDTNFGMITLKETSVLVDSVDSPSALSQQTVAMAIAHELTQQWLGNLVTPTWWDNLWLAEGIATAFEYWLISEDPIFSVWNYGPQSIFEQQNSMSLDQLNSARALITTIESPAEIASNFDSLTFSKGAALTRMLSSFTKSLTGDLTDEDRTPFYTALGGFIRKYSYKAANSDDFWTQMAIELRDSRPLVNLTASWMYDPGFPLITITVEQDDRLTLKQERFLIDQSNGGANPTRFWWLPVTVRIKATTGSRDINNLVLQPTSTTHELGAVASNSLIWIKANLNNAGLFRVSYPNWIWTNLTLAVKTQLINAAAPAAPAPPSTEYFFSESDRAGLLNDALVLASAIPKPGGVSEYLSYDLALEVTKLLRYERSFVVWTSGLAELDKLASLLATEPCFANYGLFIRSLVNDLITELGWTPQDTDDMNRRLLRTAVLNYVAEFDDSTPTLNTVATLYHNYKMDPTTLPGGVQYAVFKAVVMRGDYTVWEYLWQRYLHPDVSATEKNNLIRALAATRLTSLQSRLLSMSTDPTLVRAQDRNLVISEVAANRNGGRDLAWDFFRHHSAKLKTGTGLADLIVAITSKFSDSFKQSEVSSYFTTNERSFPGLQPAWNTGLDRIKYNAQWVTRNSPEICKYLFQNFPITAAS